MSIAACLIASGFLASTLYASLVKNNSLSQVKFLNSLTNEQKVIYHTIKEEHETKYLIGLIVGAIIASLYINFVGGDSTEASSCMFIVIMMFVTYVYYMLSSKTNMVYHLKSQEQAYLWSEFQEDRARQHATGFLIGIVGYALIIWASSMFGSSYDSGYSDNLGSYETPAFSYESPTSGNNTTPAFSYESPSYSSGPAKTTSSYRPSDRY